MNSHHSVGIAAMEADEAAVRAAAKAFLAGIGEASQLPAAHPKAVALNIQGTGLQGGTASIGANTECMQHGIFTDTYISRVHVLEVGLAAEVQVQWVVSEDCSGAQYINRAGFLTLLQHAGEWVVIAAVTAPTDRPTDGRTAPTTATRVTPADFAAVAACCWDEYGGANRACDVDRMSKVFHLMCRLTYTGGDGKVVIKSQDEFLAMVGDRYKMPMHAPYAHLRDDPRAAAGDTLLSITFATPDLAMVVLKVGHPPCLWTDLLTCARLGGQWWIVAKSSCKEPLLEDEARSEDGGGKRAKTEGPSN